MSYFDTLSAEQKSNAAFIVKAATDSGITNPYTIAAILAIISKESELKPKSENLNYSAKRIGEVFPRLASRASSLANNPEALGNAAYGGKYGNAANEGYKYRGRGYNQLTFKGNYDKFGKLIGVDISKNPDLANTPDVAAKIAIAFFKDGINSLKNNGKLASYNATNINDFKNLTDSTLAIYHVNAGAGKSVSYVKGLQSSDTLGGFTRAKQRVESLFNSLKNVATESIDLAKKKPFLTIIITMVTVVSIYALIKTLKNK